LPDNQLPSN